MLIYEVACARGFEFFRTFLKIFGIYEFSATFIKLLRYKSFDVKSLLLSWDAYVYRQARAWCDWLRMVFTPDK